MIIHLFNKEGILKGQNRFILYTSSQSQPVGSRQKSSCLVLPTNLSIHCADDGTCVVYGR